MHREGGITGQWGYMVLFQVRGGRINFGRNRKGYEYREQHRRCDQEKFVVENRETYLDSFDLFQKRDYS